MRLIDNPKFKEDYTNYQKKISLIENETLRTDCTNLLIEFGRAVAAIDAHHESLMIHGKMPVDISDSRANLASIKKKLDSKLSSVKI